jgi:hypothetical protein
LNDNLEQEILDFPICEFGLGIAFLIDHFGIRYMASSTESYSQSLRAIGQALETLRINAFALEKNGDKYIVRDWEPSFLKSVADEVWGTRDFDQVSFPTQKSGDLLIYANSDAERLETQGRSRRGSNENPDSYTISSGLRLVGDYLDKKRAMTFDIWWSMETVRLRFEAAAGGPKETSFTVQNLQDLAVGMYLRRSNR